MILGVGAWGVSGVIFLCSPTQQYWDMDVTGNCMDAESHFWSTGIIGIVIDWTIWLLPMPVVGRLRLPWRQKVAVVVVFGLGILFVHWPVCNLIRRLTSLPVHVWPASCAFAWSIMPHIITILQVSTHTSEHLSADRPQKPVHWLPSFRHWKLTLPLYVHLC